MLISWFPGLLFLLLISTFGLEVDQERNAEVEEALKVKSHRETQEKVSEKIKSWDEAFKVAVMILFTNERRLLDLVFQGPSSTVADISFVEVCTQFTVRLLSFPQTLIWPCNCDISCIHFVLGHVKCCWSHKIKDRVCSTLDFLFPYFKSLFEDQNSSVLLDQVFALWQILPLRVEINNSISNFTAQFDASQWQRIIYGVMNKISEFCEQNTEDWISVDPSQYTLLTDRLKSHLEAKSQNYMDPARCCVYMINNLNYMKVLAKRPELKTYLNYDWFARIKAKIQQKLELYQRSSWNKLLDFLTLDSDESVEPSVVAESMKAKLDLFNQHFEETCEEHSTWTIVDEKIWKQTIGSLENILLPAYGNFIQRIYHVLGKHDDDCIKYEPIQIRGRLSYLLLS